MKKFSRWALVGAAFGIISLFIRWMVQGTGNLYTQTGKRFFQPDTTKGWIPTEETWFWLGLEACIAACAALVGMVGLVWLAGKIKKSALDKFVTMAVSLGGPLILLGGCAVWLFPLPPSDYREEPPAMGGNDIGTKIEGGLPGLPEGDYLLDVKKSSKLTTRISAGGEDFNAYFRLAKGTWKGNPGNLAAPIEAHIVADMKTVDTGVSMRDSHARDESLLNVAKYPVSVVRFGKLDGVKPSKDGVEFAANASFEIGEKTQPIRITGVMKAVEGDPHSFVVSGEFTFKIDQTHIDNSDGSFDKNTVRVIASLFFTNQSKDSP